VYKLRLARQDPLGVYQVRADASLNNARFETAMTSFTVQ
jgi:hypothetical protein